MAGSKNSKKKLNTTLLFLLNILNSNNIKNWFIGYGTLLGIVREDSCIDGDDDIDIICDIKCYDKIKALMMNNGLKLFYGYGIGNSKRILKTVPTDSFCSIDFYMAEIDGEGNFNDKWENVIWCKCFIDNKQCFIDNSQNLIEYKWRDTVLYMPNNFEKKLIGRYGKDWKIPRQTKGPKPRKRKI